MNSSKRQEYKSGAPMRKNFEDTMQKLFRVPKSAVEKPKPKKASDPKGDREK